MLQAIGSKMACRRVPKRNQNRRGAQKTQQRASVGVGVGGLSTIMAMARAGISGIANKAQAESRRGGGKATGYEKPDPGASTRAPPRPATPHMAAKPKVLIWNQMGMILWICNMFLPPLSQPATQGHDLDSCWT